jgi:acyl-coenzyme A synthetase/AMP-(fatty) acid ligase
LARVDEDGYLYIVGRAKDFLKCAGKRVSCRQLEETILECPQLLEAAVIGVPDDTLGEAVKAFVVPSNGCTGSLEDQVKQFCKQRLPLAMVPSRVVILDALPKNSSGKVIKDELRNLEPSELWR